MDNVHMNSTGLNGCMGSLATKCEDDVDGRWKIQLENCLPGDADCTGVWMLDGNEES